MFLVSKNACALRGFRRPDGPKFDVRARGFPRAPSACRRAGCCPFRCSLRSAPGGHPPAAGLGRVVSASRVRASPVLRNPRHARPAGCAWLRLLRAALDPAPSLKTRLRASQSLVDTFKRPSGATGHRIALGGPLRPPDGHSGPAWSSPAPQAWFRGSAPAPSPFGFDALADGSIEPLPERLALSMGGSDRRVSGLGRHPADGPRSRPRPFFGNSRHRLNPFNENNVLSKSGQHRLTRKHTRFGPRR